MILDCGGVDIQQVARSIRGLGAYCEIVHASKGFEAFVGRNPTGIVCVGNEMQGVDFPPLLLGLDAPLLAIGEASRSLAIALSGTAEQIILQDKLCNVSFSPNPLFEGVEGGMRRVERAYDLALPPSCKVIATVEQVSVGFAQEEKQLYGLQFLLERNDMDGYRILSNFVLNICQCSGTWSLRSYLDSTLEGLRNRVGDGIAICPMTGGVDSAICAALTYRALGNDHAKCILVDTGLMSLGEGEAIERAFVEELEVPILRIQAYARFLQKLQGVVDPTEKRRIAAKEFSDVLTEQEASFQGKEIFIIKSTIYNDILDGVSLNPATAGVPAHWTIIEPVRGLFKYEVRELGEMLGVPAKIVARQPFPSAGLAVRCLGEVTAERIAILRSADAIFKQLLEKQGQDKGLRQYFAILTGIRGLNTKGERLGETVLLRAISHNGTNNATAARLSYDLLETVVDTILKEIPGVSRVFYDLSPKPPAAIELE